MNERGAASVALLGVLVFALMLGAAVASVGAFFEGRTRAAAAADAAALAAAPVTFLPFGARGTPAEEAARFAAANGASLVGCSCPVDRSWAHRTVIVDVERRVRLWPVGAVTVRARGRAEFSPALLLGGG
ncbi:MAG TPA: Rv3654c family TadE-like protein [Acidimicrobiia bacterium]|nr:Rv3654c family TadE-like protein [Acidimicrobiia bacterium]